MKRFAFKTLLPAISLALMSTLAQAGELANLSIVNQQTGERLTIWRHQGQNYVVGQPGQRYALQVTNKTGGRLLSVMSVDGINVINGATATPQQSGYVLDPWRQLDVAGWRKNMGEVAAFYFTQLRDSYAARTGRGDQTGVIGVAIFREQSYQPRPPVYRDSRSGEAAAPPSSTTPYSGGQSSKRARNFDSDASKLGTGHGERLDSASRMTDFQRASSSPAEIITVYYDSYENLADRGIIPRERHHRRHNPDPFPGGFVPDPR